MRCSRLLLACALAALGGGPAAAAAESAAPQRPNIVFIFSDDHSPNAIGAYDRWLKSVDPTPEGNIRVEGHCTDIVTDMAVKWLRETRDPGRPFMLRVQHKVPHRNWMPALRHLDAFGDVLIPEPPSLFMEHETQTPASRYQEMEIDRHMDIHYDLFLDLTPDSNFEPVQKRQDRSAWHNMRKMTSAQLGAWRDHFGPLDEAFHAADLEGKDLVRWKYQRDLRNYLGCIRGVDESVATVLETLDELAARYRDDTDISEIPDPQKRQIRPGESY
jgi:arylsulfatase A-like enzyme